MRKPVISARTPAVEEFFTHRQNIFLCDEPLPHVLARAIIELRDDTALRERIAANAYTLVRKNHSPQAIGALLIEVLRRRFG
jgi:glycosyltransferase involved in cell wall biosynthesis